MKVKDIIKKQTTMVAIAVIMVVVAALGVSYALFFDVKSNTSDQVITAGTLSLNVTKGTTLAVDNAVSSSTGLSSTAYTYTVKNSGNLPASYKVYIYPDSSNTLALSNVTYSLNGATGAALTSSLTKSTCSVNNTNYDCYLVESGTLAASASNAAKSIRMWVDEDTTSTTLNGTLSLNLYITSEVNE